MPHHEQFWWLKQGDTLLEFVMKVNRGSFASADDNEQKMIQLLERVLSYWPSLHTQRRRLEQALKRASAAMDEDSEESRTYSGARKVRASLDAKIKARAAKEAAAAEAAQRSREEAEAEEARRQQAEEAAAAAERDRAELPDSSYVDRMMACFQRCVR